jgi:hypothetical protein
MLVLAALMLALAAPGPAAASGLDRFAGLLPQVGGNEAGTGRGGAVPSGGISLSENHRGRFR